MKTNESAQNLLPNAYAPGILPKGIRSRFVQVNGLRMHVLEAGYETPARSCVLLLHGFPELAYSWRHNMLHLAAQGFHVIAPDQRGFGRTTGWQDGYDVDLKPFGIINLVTDMVVLVNALGHRRVQAVIGHDTGVQVAAMAALIRPDIFRSLILLSAPFPGVPGFALGVEGLPVAAKDDPIHEKLAALKRPRKHYQLYYTTAEAGPDLSRPPQGIHAFLRASFHYKSADWEGNKPFALKGWTAEELAQMPTYYIMDQDKGMAATVAPFMPDKDNIRACTWLTEQELQVFSTEYTRTGFQGGLNWFRCGMNGLNAREMTLYAGRKIDVPTLFLAGSSDWCPYQLPNALEKMSQQVFSDFRGCSFIEGAGHWLQQEQPEKTNALLIRFLAQS